nr:MAG TPA: hypothetical protein [Caudoviricetes sp.]
MVCCSSPTEHAHQIKKSAVLNSGRRFPGRHS